jgi:dienelactone hydrolase
MKKHLQLRSSVLSAAALMVMLGYSITVNCAETPVEQLSAVVKPAMADTIRAIDFDWQDSQRQRDVPVRLYLPKAVPEPAAQGGAAVKPVPLIVFSHGLGGSRNGYQYLGRFWAANGYASMHVQHIGSDNQLWRGNPFSLTMRLKDAAKDSEAVARAKDVSFALTEMLAQPQLAGRFDASRIVAAGHSYGANTTMLLAGAAVPNKGENGQILNLRDPRIKAAMLLSAPPFYGYSNPALILGGITLPTLHVTATEDDIMVPGYGSGVDDRVGVFNAMGDPRKTLVVFAGGSHSIFTDRTGTGGVELNPKVKAATQALSLAFLRQTLGGEDGALAQWQPQFADLVARFVNPAK